jgi:peptidoglycan/LPS O-acetylase OafA/YrhL
MKLRSFGAVLGGFVVILVLSTAVDVILHATGVFPPWGKPMSDPLFALATAYRIVISIFGCYIAARLAPDRPMRHALALGVFGVVVSTVATIVTWNRGPEFGPHWYPIALILVAMPCAWIGGKLGERKIPSV